MQQGHVPTVRRAPTRIRTAIPLDRCSGSTNESAFRAPRSGGLVQCANQEAGKCYALPHYTVSEAAVEPAVMGPKLVKTTTAEIAEDRLPARLDRVRRSAVPRLIIQLSVPPCRQKLCEKTTGRGYRCEILLVGRSFAKDTALSRERDRRFESISLQQRVCQLSVPRESSCGSK